MREYPRFFSFRNRDAYLLELCRYIVLNSVRAESWP